MERNSGSGARSSGFQLCNLEPSEPPVSHLQAGGSGTGMKSKRTDMPKDSAWLEESTAIVLQSPPIRLTLQADPAWIPKPGSLEQFKLFHFPSPKASLHPRVVWETQANKSNKQTSQVIVPLSDGAALPLSPHSCLPGTPGQTQSRAPLLPWTLA